MPSCKERGELTTAEERNSIARGTHDDLVQDLAGLLLGVERCLNPIDVIPTVLEVWQLGLEETLGQLRERVLEDVVRAAWHPPKPVKGKVAHGQVRKA